MLRPVLSRAGDGVEVRQRQPIRCKHRPSARIFGPLPLTGGLRLGVGQSDAPIMRGSPPKAHPGQVMSVAFAFCSQPPRLCSSWRLEIESLRQSTDLALHSHGFACFLFWKRAFSNTSTAQPGIHSVFHDGTQGMGRSWTEAVLLKIPLELGIYLLGTLREQNGSNI